MFDSIDLNLDYRESLSKELSGDRVLNELIVASLLEAFNLQRLNILRWVNTLHTGDWNQMREMNHNGTPAGCICFNSNVDGFLKEVKTLCECYSLTVEIYHNGLRQGKLLFPQQPEYALFFDYSPDIYLGDGAIIYKNVIRVTFSFDENVSYKGSDWKKCSYD